MTRRCPDCGTDISNSHGSRIRCVNCVPVKHNENTKKMERYRTDAAYREAAKAQCRESNARRKQQAQQAAGTAYYYYMGVRFVVDHEQCRSIGPSVRYWEVKG